MIPNQCIYSFRGSNLEILSQFSKEYLVTELHLTINHRSTKKIVEYSNNLISHNNNRFNVALTTDNQEGVELVFKNPTYATDCAEYIATIIEKEKMIDPMLKYNDFLILYRQNQSKGIYQQALLRHGIPHYLYGIGFLEYKEVKFTLMYYRLILNHDDNEAFACICNNPPRGIADVLMSKIRLQAYNTKKSYYAVAKEMNNEILNQFINLIEELTDMLHYYSFSDFYEEIVKVVNVRKFSKGYYDEKRRVDNLSALKQIMLDYYEESHDKNLTKFFNEIAMKPDDSVDPGNKVKLMTIHQAKGLEAKIVILVDARDEVIPAKKQGMEIEEERRIFYVAITRAKEKLYILSSDKNGPRDTKRNVPSRFIKELK